MEDFFKSLEVQPATTGPSAKQLLIVVVAIVVVAITFLIYWFVIRKKHRYALCWDRWTCQEGPGPLQNGARSFRRTS